MNGGKEIFFVERKTVGGEIFRKKDCMNDGCLSITYDGTNEC